MKPTTTKQKTTKCLTINILCSTSCPLRKIDDTNNVGREASSHPILFLVPCDFKYVSLPLEALDVFSFFNVPNVKLSS
jgi:hypothetical protein